MLKDKNNRVGNLQKAPGLRASHLPSGAEWFDYQETFVSSSYLVCLSDCTAKHSDGTLYQVTTGSIFRLHVATFEALLFSTR